jgi:hypothetical protein
MTGTSHAEDVLGSRVGTVNASRQPIGIRGGIDLPKRVVDLVKSHLAKYYKKMGDSAPWERGCIKPSPSGSTARAA